MVCGSTVQALTSSATTGDNPRGDWCQGRPVGEGERADHGAGIGSAAPPRAQTKVWPDSFPSTLAVTQIYLTPEVSMKGLLRAQSICVVKGVLFYPLATVSIHASPVPGHPWRGC